LANSGAHDTAAWDVINGRLVRPFAESLRVSKTYWIVCPRQPLRC
jgi:hypothetical protein